MTPNLVYNHIRKRDVLKKEPLTLPEQIWQFFCSVKLAVYTLILLACTSVIGTVILQNGTQQQYLREYGPGFYNLIKIFDFDDMYHAWWFLGLIFILCINIVVCSVERLSFTWKIIFPKKVRFNRERFRKQKNIQTFSLNSDHQSLLTNIESVLSGQIGKVYKEDTDNSIFLFAEKGRWTRLGVYVVHASILLLLIGALIGALFGFKARLNLDEGNATNVAFNSKGGGPVDLGFTIRCNDFDVSFYDTGAPKEFKSNLTVLEDGKEKFSRDILVNHPLRYKGINIFQASYGNLPSDKVLLDVFDTKSDKKIDTRTFTIGDIYNLPENKGQFVLEGFTQHAEFRKMDLGGAFIGKIVPQNGEPFEITLPISPRMAKFDRMRKGEFAFIVKEVQEKYFTGLQITSDPGVWYVYAGFTLMIIGCWITFFMSHQSVMVEIQSNEQGNSVVSVSGTANRNAQGMKLKIKKLVNKLKG